VAVELAPWLGAGVAVNIWDGTRDYDHDLADGSTLWWESDYSGVNATLGVRVDLAYSTSRYLRDSVAGTASATTTRTYQTLMLQVAVGLGQGAMSLR